MNNQTLIEVTPSYDNWPMSGLPGTSARYIIRPLFIRNGETQPPLSLCAVVDEGPLFRVWPVYSKSCSTTVCFASQGFATWEFIDKGGFSTPGMGVMIKGSWISLSLNSSGAPTVDVWAVREARMNERRCHHLVALCIVSWPGKPSLSPCSKPVCRRYPVPVRLHVSSCSAE